jgi:hypothetical protein
MNRKSRAMIDQVKRLLEDGRSIKRIAHALSLSRNTVRRYIRGFSADVEKGSMSEAPSPETDPCTNVDWERVTREVALGRPVKRVYEEMDPGMSYSHFTRLARSRSHRLPATAVRLVHEPANEHRSTMQMVLRSSSRSPARRSKRSSSAGCCRTVLLRTANLR